MWIRTQNKYILANANSFRIRKDSIDTWVYYAINGYYDGYEQELGIYSTKEKALKVLDQVQYNMEPFEHEPTMVFQMPQDEDVQA